MRRPVVALYQMRLLHFRVPLFEAMRDLAREADIDLHVVCGQASRNAAVRRDQGSLAWVERVTNRYLEISDLKDLCWQPMPAGLRRPDLIILMQENRIISNYRWLVKRRFGGPKVAFWGHGRDLRASPTSFRNRFKAAVSSQVDWYFAYTQHSLDLLRASGFPESRITVVNNSIDTEGLCRDMANVPEASLQRLRDELDLGPGEPLALYCGSLYPDRLLPMLVEAGGRVHARHSGFRLVVMGEGPCAAQLVELTAGQPWVRWVGSKRGPEKAAFFRLASFMVNPGLVGLQVLDAFAAGLPLLTTRCRARHGPEIAYLVNGRNGMITETGAAEFSAAIEDLVDDRARLSRLAAAAAEDGKKYSIGKMATRFVEGMIACLRAERR